MQRTQRIKFTILARTYKLENHDRRLVYYKKTNDFICHKRLSACQVLLRSEHELIITVMAYHTRDSENLQIFIKHIDNHTYIPDFQSENILVYHFVQETEHCLQARDLLNYWLFFLRGRECQQYVKEEQIIFRKSRKKYRKHFNNFMKIVIYSTMDNLEVKI